MCCEHISEDSQVFLKVTPISLFVRFGLSGVLLDFVKYYIVIFFVLIVVTFWFHELDMVGNKSSMLIVVASEDYDYLFEIVIK